MTDMQVSESFRGDLNSNSVRTKLFNSEIHFDVMVLYLSIKTSETKLMFNKKHKRDSIKSPHP